MNLIFLYSEKQRIPSWTDRILWYVSPQQMRFCVDNFIEDGAPLRQFNYNSHPSYFNSDHKPVSCTFEIKV